MGEQANKQHSSLASTSVLASRLLLCVLALTSLDEGLQDVSFNKPFSPRVAFGHGVLS